MGRGFKKLILLSRSGSIHAPYIIITPQVTEFGSNGGTTTITLKSNTEWNITIN